MKLHIIVDRYKKSKDWTLSKFSFTGEFEFNGKKYKYHNQQMGVGIEDEVRKEDEKKVWGETAIPAGTYKLTLTDSPKFSGSYYRDNEGNIVLVSDRDTATKAQWYSKKHEMILINDIPGFSRVLIHWGNTDDDSAGCYIVGSYVGKKGEQEAVLQSRKKYVEIYPIIWRAIKSGAEVFITFA